MKKGAAYHDAIKTDDNRVVGVSYQIASINEIDVSAEAFNVSFEFNMLYKIDESDREFYAAAQENSESFQSLFDRKPRLSNPPPILEVRNAKGPVETLSERVVQIDEITREGGRTELYVSLYGNYRATCDEPMEVTRFPFIRQSLQILLVSKTPTSASKSDFRPAPKPGHGGMISFVPWNFFLSEHQLVQDSNELRPRNNNFKGNAKIKSWVIENHHLAIVPEGLTPLMPSGKKYCRILIVAQAKLIPNYFLYNICFVVFLLTSLSITVIFIQSDDLADRLGTLLALLLTIAAYKSSVAATLPQKPYATFLDMYILFAFFVIFLFCVFVVVDKEEPMKYPKKLTASILLLVWTCLHVPLVFFNRFRMYSSWANVIKEENEQLMAIKKAAERGRSNVDCS